MDGIIQEIRGDLKAAQALFEKHLAPARPADRRMVMMHLEAVKAGRRRGEI